MNLADALRSAMQYVDNTKQAIGRGVSDLVSNPGDVLDKWGSQVKEDLGEQAARDRLTFAMLKAGDSQGAAQNAVGDYLPLSTLGMTAYHGSPHLFDKFDMSKIGTGEGAQAYGHGLYFAENPAVAKNYAADRAYVGRAMAGNPDGADWGAEQIAKQAMDVHGSDAATHLQAVLRQNSRLTNPAQAAENQKVQDAIALIKDGKVARSGNLYKVDIPDEHVAKMLDWDRPVSEQPQAVQDVAKQWNGGKLPNESMTGDQLLRYIEQQKRFAGLPGRAEDEFKKAGVPGIRYLDGGSRGKGGTSNFVVFDDAIPKIIGKE